MYTLIIKKFYWERYKDDPDEEIIIETKKAIGFLIDWFRDNCYEPSKKEIEKMPKFIWLPKSQIKVKTLHNCTEVHIPHWLWEKSELWKYKVYAER